MTDAQGLSPFSPILPVPIDAELGSEPSGPRRWEYVCGSPIGRCPTCDTSFDYCYRDQSCCDECSHADLDGVVVRASRQLPGITPLPEGGIRVRP